jgi:hypothetical protein
LGSCPERRAVIIRSARRDVCARVLPPAPFPLGWDENGRQGRALEAGRDERALRRIAVLSLFA